MSATHQAVLFCTSEFLTVTTIATDTTAGSVTAWVAGPAAVIVTSNQRGIGRLVCRISKNIAEAVSEILNASRHLGLKHMIVGRIVARMKVCRYSKQKNNDKCKEATGRPLDEEMFGHERVGEWSRKTEQ